MYVLVPTISPLTDHYAKGIWSSFAVRLDEIEDVNEDKKADHKALKLSK